MPTTTLNNAPLVELVAEVRWQPSGDASTPIAMPQPAAGISIIGLSPTNDFEEFFMRFGAAAANLKYPVAERVVPAGIPFIVGQPVYRFRQQVQGELTSLYQVGVGLFSANAIPPYKTWDQFSPVVKAGVEATLETRPKSESQTSFSTVSLRYIDAFGPDLTQEMDVSTFLAEVLGIKIQAPEGLTKRLAAGGKIIPSMQIQIPMQGGMMMNVGIGSGTVNGKPSIVLDTVVATTAPVAANVDAVMQSMDSARSAIHDMFFDLTAPIMHLMKPLETA